MNISIFSRLLRAQLLQHNRVSLPGLGSFIAEDQAPVLQNEGRSISAPARVIRFSVKETWNDGWLERAYAAEMEQAMLELEEGDELPSGQMDEKSRDPSSLFLEQAKREVMQFVSIVESQLYSSGMYHFPGFGTMKMEGRKHEISFEKAIDCDLSPQEFGLISLPIKPLTAPARIMEPQPVRIQPPKETPKPPKTPKRPKSPKPPKTKARLKRNTSKWIYIVLGIFLLIILFFLLVYIFRAELMPWLEHILYSPEERRLLNFD